MNIRNLFRPTDRLFLINKIVTHLAFLYFLYTGTLTEWAIVLSIYLFRVTIGATVTLHRLLSHRSFTAPKWFEYIGSLIGTIGSGLSPIVWVAVHREHHRFPDTEKDPHSPLHVGFLNVQFRSQTVPKIKYVPDLLRSKFHTTLHQYHWAINLIVIVILALIDPRSLLYVYFVPNLIYWHSGGFINTLNHSKFGYRSFDTNDQSVNNILTGYLVAGEGWHNNHHATPSDPKFGKKWWEFDLGWQVIKLVRKL